MGYTLYDISIPVAQDALKSVIHILQVGEQQPNAASLPAARLHADMHPLTFQIKIITETAVKLLARLSGSEVTQFTGDLVTFADMYTRIKEAQDVLDKADKDLISSRIDEKILMGVDKEGNKALYPANALVHGYSLPTLFFHVTTVYGILRKEGVPLAKHDYINSFGDRFDQ